MTKHAKNNIQYTLSTLAIEGLKPSREAVKLYGALSDRKLSLSETLKAIERIHGVSGTTHG